MNKKDVLEELLGKNVEVWTLKGDTHYAVIGILEAFDDQWIKLRQGHGSSLYLSVANTRLIKPS
jgi:hypothetical protein